ncbi:hypothetical protein AB4Z13_27345 [Rhizobium sp. YAF28]|uniref:hypothetical protein n=1 Tax=Rhizobium sp. YAF28 TaxID=3233081 RepID=UPI003F969015
MTSASDVKEGELFRLNYLRSASKLSDSSRARIRMNKLFEASVSHDYWGDFAELLESSLGIEVDGGSYVDVFWKTAEIGDFLSAITLWARSIRFHSNALQSAQQIFQDEQLRYRIDSKGGVHFLVDEQFEQVVQSTLDGLGDQKFASSRHALTEALKSLAASAQSGKGLIRGVFEAAESAFLVVCGPNAGNRLNAQAAEKHLKPILLARYTQVPDAIDKVDRMLVVFNSWVKDAHPYRHGAPFEQIHEAPLDLAVLSASTGMGFIRFLAGIGPKV